MNTMSYGVSAYAAAATMSLQQSSYTGSSRRSAQREGTTQPGMAQEQAVVYEKGQNGVTAAGYDRTGRKIGTDAAGVVKQSSVDTVLNKKSADITTSRDYGQVIGEPKLSEEAQKYYKELKGKYANMDFVLVSKDMIGAAKSRAASYGNAQHMVVLIDEEKLERMATDESYRKKYEGIIAQAQMGGSKLQNTVYQNPNVKKVGINVLDNGAGSFMAACAKSNGDAAQKQAEKREAKRIEKKAADKKAAKKKAQKAAEEKRKEERLEERREEKRAGFRDKSVISEDDFSEYLDNDEYEIIYADTMDELIQKLEEYNNRTGFGQNVAAGARYTDVVA